eukprot:TRINITY_DN2661_c0_g2_i1.p1 TRINITY_DN2661_c0_g2~~TRINITY_DN2661_c0_g2_i1.p1  ORF type:complete len:230 (+),score=52.68 TRINITY_DN2661_c0_g2_i1:42-731(+)
MNADLLTTFKKIAIASRQPMTLDGELVPGVAMCNADYQSLLDQIPPVQVSEAAQFHGWFKDPQNSFVRDQDKQAIPDLETVSDEIQAHVSDTLHMSLISIYREYTTPSVEFSSPIGPYTKSRKANKTFYLSGSIGTNSNGDLVEGIENQTQQAFDNIAVVLYCLGLDFSNILKCTVMLNSINDYGAMNSVYANMFDGNFPARSAYAVDALPKNSLVEIECIAYWEDCPY